MNKKVIIIGVSILVVVIIILSIIVVRGKKETTPQYQVFDIYQVFELEDINESEYEIEKSKEVEISTKYTAGKNVYKLNGNVNFIDKTGKMIYIREIYCKVNIFQTEYNIDKYESISIQVEGIINGFENMCKTYLRLDSETKPSTEILFGEDINKVQRPLGESIYFENKLYSKTYTKENKEYDINFYRKDDKIICEFAVNEI